MIQMCCGQVTWFLFAIKTGNGHPLFDIHWWELTCRIYPWIHFFTHNPMNHPYYCEYECPFYIGINIGIEFNIWLYGCLPKMLNPWPWLWPLIDPEAKFTRRPKTLRWRLRQDPDHLHASQLWRRAGLLWFVVWGLTLTNQDELRVAFVESWKHKQQVDQQVLN